MDDGLMHTLTVTISDALRQRLDALAERTGKTIDACLLTAVEEFAETWERHLDDVHQIDEHEARAVLKAAAND
jgi:predicted transcriptional regulator